MLNDTKTRKDRMTRPRPEKMIRVEVFVLPSTYKQIEKLARGKMTASQWVREAITSILK